MKNPQKCVAFWLLLTVTVIIQHASDTVKWLDFDDIWPWPWPLAIFLLLDKKIARNLKTTALIMMQSVL